MKNFIILFILGIGITNAQWYEQELKDEFGDPSGTVVTQQLVDGTFSNSATINSELTVLIRKVKNVTGKYTYRSYSISLYEYNKHEADVYKDNYVYVSMKAANGDKIKGSIKGGFSLTKWYKTNGKGKGYMSYYSNDELVHFIDNHEGEIKVVMVEGSSIYKFTILNGI